MERGVLAEMIQQFEVTGVHLSMREQLMLIEVENDFAKATITPHGASVLSFVPKSGNASGQDLLWVSDAAVYTGEKPVRGGIPICWPWFGPSQEAGLPAHGFVRNRVWHLDSVRNLEAGVTEVILMLESDDASLAVWPHAFRLELKIEIGTELVMTLITHNLNDHDIEVTEAFHSYFTVSDAESIQVDGLVHSFCYDKLTNADPVEQTESLKITPPIDSVFIDQLAPIKIKDAQLQRNICIEKGNGRSAVVWNPGPEIIKGFADMPNDAWPTMLCVEAGNVLQNAVWIPSGEKHKFIMKLYAE
ncbi:MAG: D-hexose-6-phosphate mutarotase, partial [Hydrogenovibrio crunogenus]|nr:D-hexose-6-phosphate mutarotase [Hydrogenovibrio crunogenus]